MNTLRLLPAFVLMSSTILHGADAPSAPPAAATVDASSFKSADEFWAYIEKLQEQPKAEPKSREEALQILSEWLGKQQAAADAFVKAYPQDANRWKAAILSLRASAQLRRYTGKATGLPEDRQKIADIVNAPDAPAVIKGEAAFMGVMLNTSSFDPAKPETFTPFYTAAADYLEKYAEHPLAQQLKQIQLRVLNDDPSPASDALLKKIAASTDARSAEAAKSQLAAREKMMELKKAPVDIKFTSSEGQEVDLAKLRGKVVLVDFWASWCGPCIAEMPNVVSTYEKLHAKGFEIIGISLDQDKAAMEGALKKHQMTWAQYFDGAGWENKISRGFGIRSIPAAWLIDKKGMLRETGLRGEALGTGVEKLLAE